MPSVLTFNERVWRLTAQIPRGRVSTYGLIAKALGSPRACRGVGNALNANPHAPRVPCHRVVRGNGQLGGYADGTAKKARILRQEGIQIGPKNKVVNFKKVLYSRFSKIK
jgi:methylated-DNA-[protein]-cysteine S-methyltransferase